MLGFHESTPCIDIIFCPFPDSLRMVSFCDFMILQTHSTLFLIDVNRWPERTWVDSIISLEHISCCYPICYGSYRRSFTISFVVEELYICITGFGSWVGNTMTCRNWGGGFDTRRRTPAILKRTSGRAKLYEVLPCSVARSRSCLFTLTPNHLTKPVVVQSQRQIRTGISGEVLFSLSFFFGSRTGESKLGYHCVNWRGLEI